MGSNKSLKRGDIWLVNLDPTIGHEIKKSRLAVIIQNDTGNKYSPITIIAPITSQGTKDRYPFEVLINRNNSTIKKESKVLLNQIRAIDKQRLIRKYATLTKKAIFQVDEAIKISLGLE